MRDFPLPSVGGIDFGFHNPFAAEYGHLDDDDVLWITGERYIRDCILPTHSKALPKGVRYWCDPAQPGSIVELRQAGHDVVPCIHMSARGAGGEKRNPKMAGIDLVSNRIRTRRLKIVRTACPNLVWELGLYHYDESKLPFVEDPVDEDNHAVDALRYLVVGIDRRRSVPSHVVHQTDDEIEAEMKAERERERQERFERERAVRENPDIDDERIWGN